MSERYGWFADTSEDSPKDYPWQPCLQLDMYCADIDIWFESREACEQWIKNELLGKEMLQ
jgi:hypothetical protein